MNNLKCLTKSGEIVYTCYKAKHRYNDISKRLKVLKSYKLQFDVLGYIISSGNVYKDCSHINALVNKQINRSLELPLNCNAQNLVHSVLSKGKASKNIIRMLQEAKEDPKQAGFLGLYQKHFARLHRKALIKGIDLTLERY